MYDGIGEGAEEMERERGVRERDRGVQNIKHQQVNVNKGYAEVLSDTILKRSKSNPLWSSMPVAG